MELDEGSCELSEDSCPRDTGIQGRVCIMEHRPCCLLGVGNTLAGRRVLRSALTRNTTPALSLHPVGEVPVPPFASQITLSRRLCRAGPTLPPSLTLCRGPFASHFDVCRGSLRWTAKMGWQMPIAVECSRRCGSVRVSSDADVTPACVSVESHGSCTGFFGQAGH